MTTVLNSIELFPLQKLDNGDMNEHLKRVKNNVSRGNYSITEKQNGDNIKQVLHLLDEQVPISSKKNE